MAHILVAEDEKTINDLITMNLRLVGHTFKKVFEAPDAIDILKIEKFELILFDTKLLDKNSFEIIKQIKRTKIPVIFIIAEDCLSNRIKGFNAAKENYIIRPFEILELLVKINLTVRKVKRDDDSSGSEEIEIDLVKKEVSRNGKIIEMTAKEYELLEVLMNHRNVVLSRKRLLELVWGCSDRNATRTVDVHISRLRKKLAWDDKIKTVFKLGYRLED